MSISAYAEGLPHAEWRLWGTPERPSRGWTLPAFLNEMRDLRRRPTLVLEGPNAEEAARRVLALLENPPATGEESGELIRRGVSRLLGAGW